MSKDAQSTTVAIDQAVATPISIELIDWMRIPAS
jgi:hypothetical protein